MSSPLVRDSAAQPTKGKLTAWLQRASSGDRQAEERLLQVLYDDLRRMARRQLGRERGDHTLQPTALVHEAYVRLMHGATVQWKDRVHFFATASTVMRRVLVDHARRRSANKRGQGTVVLSLSEVGGLEPHHSPERMLAVDHALTALEQIEPRQARVVELRFFAGLTEDEVAGALGISPRTVKREWAAAKAWLYQHLDR
jgi:RNA polymerase sigma-70 factor (ECF subfamily)